MDCYMYWCKSQGHTYTDRRYAYTHTSAGSHVGSHVLVGGTLWRAPPHMGGLQVWSSGPDHCYKGKNL